LPRLLPADLGQRRALLDKLEAIVTAAGDLNADGRRRLKEIKEIFNGPVSAPLAEAHIAAE